MSFSAPKPPDPGQTASTQQQYNLQAGQQQNATNSYGQTSNYGSISFVPDSSQPSGYRLVTSLSPEQQKLYDTYTGTQGVFGAAAPGEVQAGLSNINAPANLDPTTVTKQLNEWQQKYQQPIFDQQSSNLEAQLRSQGLTPGSEAYNNAKNLLARNQGDVTNQYLTLNQGQAFDQALKAFQAQQQQGQTQLQAGGTLFGAAAPTGPTQLNTPTSQIQPANYQGAVEENYKQQAQNYNNFWNSIGQLGGAATNLIGRGFTGGGMFGSSPGSDPNLISGSYTYGGVSVPKVGGGWG